MHIAQGLQAVTPEKSAAIAKFILRAIQECPNNIHKIMPDYGNLLAKKPSTKSQNFNKGRWVGWKLNHDYLIKLSIQ